MSIYKELSYDQEIERVSGIQFNILGTDEIIRRSVVEVTKTETYAGNQPVIGGLFDPRMGVLEHGKTCATCEQKNTFCPGHFGHINLARPVYHPLFFDMVRKVLGCVCYRCSRLLVSPTDCGEGYREEISKIMGVKSNQKRWEAMQKLCGSAVSKGKRCGDFDGGANGCGAKQPSRYRKENSMKIIAEWKAGSAAAGVMPEEAEPVAAAGGAVAVVGGGGGGGGGGLPGAFVDASGNVLKELMADDVLRIFSRISDDDCFAMGFNPRTNRPDFMIWSAMSVPPPAVRPSIIEENGQRREDDLTYKLCDIVKTNNHLKAKIEKGSPNPDHIKWMTLALQYHIATFIDNQIPGLPPAQQRNGRKTKGLSDRLKKKDGRIRGNLNGKRVDQSARSVITPDPYMSLDEVGVPIKIAMNTTFPEIVNRYNVAELRELVRVGPDSWPGAKYVRSAETGVTKTLKTPTENREKLATELRDGDIVDRHIRDGDFILFNRQPSLHKMSMMGHKVRVMPYQSCRLNPNATASYNADFDGDEMNCFMTQSVQSMFELMDLAAVPYMILTPRDGKPIVEVIQDAVVGSYRMTQNFFPVSDKLFANMQMVNGYFTGAMPTPDPRAGADLTRSYTGQQLFSQLFPPGLFMDVGKDFKVVNSQIVKGVVGKKVFHNMSTGIVATLFHDYGPFEALRFFNNLEGLLCRWLMTSGFSVGISDLVLSKETDGKLSDAIGTMKDKAYAHLEKVRNEGLENNSVFPDDEYFEHEMTNILNETNSIVSGIALDQIDPATNRMINMIKSGSKGKDANVAQMVACVGQQNVAGKRVAYGFTDRTLPHFCKFDDGPDARGFVENSFISGLTPTEVFFHAMGGREGLIDTAIKTADTGYLQRRLVKAMEDCKVYYDHTVRNATGAIVQFVYGEDGMDGTKIEQQPLPMVGMSCADMDAAYLLRGEDEAALKITLTADALAETIAPETLERARAHYDALVADREFVIMKVFGGEKGDMVTFPIPFTRLVRSAVGRAREAGLEGVMTDLSAKHVLDTIDDLVARLDIQRMKPNAASAGERAGPGAARFLGMLVRLNLSPKQMLLTHHMQRASFDWIVAEVTRYYIQAIAPPGEMVGIVSAQTIGENSTQLVLDSFHSSGTVAAVKATSGVPRFKELLGCSKHIKTPILKIHLRPDIATVATGADGRPRPPGGLGQLAAAETGQADDEGRRWALIGDPREGAPAVVFGGASGGAGSDRAVPISREIAVTEAKARAMKVMRTLEVTRLSDILESSELYWDPPGDDGLETAIPEDAGMLALYRLFTQTEPDRCRSTSSWVLRLKLNREAMHRIGVTMMDIYLQLNTAYTNTIDCLFSDDNADELIFRIRLQGAALAETGLKDSATTDDRLAAIKAMEHNMLHSVLLKGVRGIKKVSMHSVNRQVKRAGAWDFDEVTEWVLDTDGTNLQEILGNPNVDPYRTSSNDIWEIYHTLGVEAARNALYREIADVTGKDSMNYRHVSLLLDTMTNRGTMMSVDRHGINRGDVGPLAKCSFEETTDMLINASIFSEFDAINGVSANIMLGQLPPCGTGDCDILLDEDAYIAMLADRRKATGVRARPSAEAPRGREVVAPIPQEEMAGAVAPTDPCGYGAIAFQYELPQRRQRPMASVQVAMV